MKQILKIQSFLLIISIFLSIQLNATLQKKHNMAQRKNCIITKAALAKITGAQFLRASYLICVIQHIMQAMIKAPEISSGNGKDSNASMRQGRKGQVLGILKKISDGLNHDANIDDPVIRFIRNFTINVLIELGGVYCCFYSFSALSKYIKKLKRCKDMPDELSEIPSQFKQENYEDTDKIVLDILLHFYIAISSAKLANDRIDVYRYAWTDWKMSKDWNCDHEFLRKQQIGKRIGSIWDLILGPILLPSQIFTGYNSVKTIISNFKTLIANYKKELPKDYLSN